MKTSPPTKFAIALVDDDPSVLFALSSTLKGHGLDILGYGEAKLLLIDLAKGVRVDCVVAGIG